MLRVAVVVHLVVAAWAGAVAAQPRADGAPEYVLVRRDQPLYVHPDRAAARARDPWARRFVTRLGPYWVMRWVGERDGWVELLTGEIPEAWNHCYETATGLREYELRVFVPREALVPVVVAPVRRELPGGGHVAVAAGVGLEPVGAAPAGGPGRYRAVLYGVTVELELDAASVGIRYRPAGRFDMPGNSSRLRAGARIAYAPGLSLRAERGSPGRRGDFDEPQFPWITVTEIAQGGDGPTATVRAYCVELRARVPPAAIERRDDPTIDAGVREARHSVREGARVMWADGTPAGTSRGATLERIPPAVNGRACIDQPLRAYWHASGPLPRGTTFRLCFDPADLR